MCIEFISYTAYICFSPKEEEVPSIQRKAHLWVCLTKKFLYTQMHELSTAVEEFVLNIRSDNECEHLSFLDNDVMSFGFALDILVPDVSML